PSLKGRPHSTGLWALVGQRLDEHQPGHQSARSEREKLVFEVKHLAVGELFQLELRAGRRPDLATPCAGSGERRDHVHAELPETKDGICVSTDVWGFSFECPVDTVSAAPASSSTSDNRAGNPAQRIRPVCFGGVFRCSPPPLPAGQYDVALLDGRQRSINAVETTVGWRIF